LKRLSPGELLKLKHFAAWRMQGLGRASCGRTWEDLLGQAKLEVLQGAGNNGKGRRWKGNVDLVASAMGIAEAKTLGVFGTGTTAAQVSVNASEGSEQILYGSCTNRAVNLVYVKQCSRATGKRQSARACSFVIPFSLAILRFFLKLFKADVDLSFVFGRHRSSGVDYIAPRCNAGLDLRLGLTLLMSA
jgi:hypothetical protein